MGIVSSAKFRSSNGTSESIMFQSPMGIVSSAKREAYSLNIAHRKVSIPDGDSFLREAQLRNPIVNGQKFQSPMGIVSSAKDSFARC